MADVLIDEVTMEEIAEAIREKSPETGTMLASEMPDVIRAISGSAEAPLNLFVNTWDKTDNLQSMPTASRPKIKDFPIATSGRNLVSVEHGCGSVTTNTTRPYVRFGETSGDGIGALKPGKTYRLQCDMEAKLYSGYTGTATRYVSLTIDARTQDGGVQLIDNRPISYRGDYGTIKAGKVDVTFTLPDNITGMYIQATPTTVTTGLFADGDYLYVRELMLTEIDGHYLPAPDDVSGEETGAETGDTIVISGGYVGNKKLTRAFVTLQSTGGSSANFAAQKTITADDDLYALLESGRVLSMSVTLPTSGTAQATYIPTQSTNSMLIYKAGTNWMIYIDGKVTVFVPYDSLEIVVELLIMER